MAAGWPKHARIYLHRSGARLIVAAMQISPKGVVLEAEAPLSLTTWDDQDLADSLKTALEQSGAVAREPQGADPPSLKASGEPSPRAFQSTFVQIDVMEVEGPGRVDYLIDARPDTRWNLLLRTTVSSQAPAGELAGRITRIFEACRDRRF